MHYPHQIDCVWLAADPTGHLAAMITAGEGPIPERVLAHHVEAMNIEKTLLDLPIIGEAQLSVQVPDATSFLALSSRGLFVYDWTDIHRTHAEASRAYELVSSPGTSVGIQNLPIALREIACDVGAVFGNAFIVVR